VSIAVLKSTGAAGERMAEIWFAQHGWQMFKVAPPSRVIGRGARLRVIYTGKGYPDFMGNDTEGEFRAVEVKEAKPCEGDSVPASRLTASQRIFLIGLAAGIAHVGILWRSGEFEMFPFTEKGSYKKGEGLN